MSTTETTTNTAMPAAWYRDPSGRHERRWWDGTEWSDRVLDGEHESSDPPVRSQPVEPTTPPEPAAPVEDDPFALSTFEDHVDPDGTEDTEDRAPGEDPMGPRGGRAGIPIAERASTAPTAGATLGRRSLILALAGGAVVLASVLWGLANHRSADQWRDRGEALQEELVDRASTTDALEQALSRSASQGARATDGQETFVELEEAAVATVEQLRRCAQDLNAVLNVLATGGDPTGSVDTANGSCGEAAQNGEALIALLDQISGS